MAKVTIGGTVYTVPELNFIALERSWPYIEEVMTTADPMKAPSAGLRIIAAGLFEGENFNPEDFRIPVKEAESAEDELIIDRMVTFLKRQLKAREMGNISKAMDDILEEAGLEANTGESPAGPVTPSMVTAPATSPSSLQPDAKGEAGTE